MIGQASRLIQLRQLEDKGKDFSSPKIISVCSGKGGTGKSFFSANYATKLAQLGNKILLVDLDMNLSNLNILLNQAANGSLSEFFEQRKSLQELIHSADKNLDLIYGDSGKEDYPRVSRETLDYLFAALKNMSHDYEYIILDSSAGADELTLHQLGKSDYIVIVTSPELTAVMDAYVILKLLNTHCSTAKNLVVINKCSNHEEAESTFEKISMASKHFLGEEPIYLGYISFDLRVHQSIVNQELLINNLPQAKPSEEISSIAEHFITITHVANNNQTLISH